MLQSQNTVFQHQLQHVLYKSLASDYVASNNDWPAVVEWNGVKYGYVHNLQGDITAIIDGSGNTVVEYTYDAWGKPLAKTGTLKATLGTLNPFRYRGYVYDEETGLYYLRSRYYNPKWGRFVNADTQFGTTGKLLGHVIFAYCYNNPIMYIDTSGNVAALNTLHNAIKDGVALTLLWYAILGKGETKDFSGNHDFYDTFTKSKVLSEKMNENLSDFINANETEKTYSDSLSFYDDLEDLKLGIGLADYTMRIKNDTITQGALFWKKKVNVTLVTVTVSDYYNFDDYRELSSFASRMNNIGYDAQKKGIVTPFNWSFTYTLVYERK